MVTPQQTWASMTAHLKIVPAAPRPSAHALGLVLAEDIVADRDLPPADRSAMDGFAVRAADVVRAPATLSIVGEVAAGSGAAPLVGRATCARIFTGANLPPGADTVVQVEHTEPAGPDRVTVVVVPRQGANVLKRAENAGQGSVLVPAGCVLGSAQLAACAAAGYDEIRVHGRPNVAVITTGRELLDPAAQADAHQERDSNQLMLVSALNAAGFTVTFVARVSDERAAVADQLRAALAAADAVVLSGGVSVGAYDFVPAAAADVGARTLVHGVAMKPGKPFLFALAGGDRPLFGLPGNPLSAATGLHEFVLPALRRMSGWSEDSCQPRVRARLRDAVPSQTGRQRYLLARLAWGADGAEAHVVPSQSSGDLVAGARADGAVVIPADAQDLGAGTLVDFRPWRSWP